MSGQRGLAEPVLVGVILFLAIQFFTLCTLAWSIKTSLDQRPTIQAVDDVLQQVGKEVDRLDKNDEKILDLVGPLLKGKIKKAEATAK